MGIFGAQGAPAQQEAAGPKAQEPLGRMGALYAATPERNGGEVKVNEHYGSFYSPFVK